jgi:hypothetical protein
MGSPSGKLQRLRSQTSRFSQPHIMLQEDDQDLIKAKTADAGQATGMRASAPDSRLLATVELPPLEDGGTQRICKMAETHRDEPAAAA